MIPAASVPLVANGYARAIPAPDAMAPEFPHKPTSPRQLSATISPVQAIPTSDEQLDQRHQDHSRRGQRERP